MTTFKYGKEQKEEVFKSLGLSNGLQKTHIIEKFLNEGVNTAFDVRNFLDLLLESYIQSMNERMGEGHEVTDTERFTYTREVELKWGPTLRILFENMSRILENDEILNEFREIDEEIERKYYKINEARKSELDELYTQNRAFTPKIQYHFDQKNIDNILYDLSGLEFSKDEYNAIRAGIEELSLEKPYTTNKIYKSLREAYLQYFIAHKIEVTNEVRTRFKKLMKEVFGVISMELNNSEIDQEFTQYESSVEVEEERLIRELVYSRKDFVEETGEVN